MHTRHVQGPDPFLFQDDPNRFRELVDCQTTGLNCLTASRAKEMTIFLMENRSRQASKLSYFAGCHEMALDVLQGEVGLPSSSWLLEFAQMMDIQIAQPEALEFMRRRCYHPDATTQFSTENMDLFTRDPELILNADETKAASKKSSKCWQAPVTDQCAGRTEKDGMSV
jgi:hypothetical protein